MTVGTHMCQEDVQHMARDFHDVTRQTIFRKYAEARVDRPPEMTGHEELFMKHTRIMKR